MTSNNERIRIGLIGAGQIGRLHAANICRHMSDCELVSIADIDADVAARCGAECGVAEVNRSALRVVEDPNVDAVLICSDTDTHPPLIEAAADEGKHIFCEAPISNDLSRIDRALEAVRDAGVKLQVGFNRRFDPSFGLVWDEVAEGRVGEPHLLRITSREMPPSTGSSAVRPGALLLDMAIHDFDVALHLMGAAAQPAPEVTFVRAAGARRLDPAVETGDDIDTAVTMLHFEDDTIATIDNSRGSSYGSDHRVEVFGSAGRVWADNRKSHMVTSSSVSGTCAPHMMKSPYERFAESYFKELEAFLASIRADSQPPVGGDHSRKPVVLALAAMHSLEQLRPVAPSEVEP